MNGASTSKGDLQSKGNKVSEKAKKKAMQETGNSLVQKESKGRNSSAPSKDDEASEEDDMSKGGAGPSKGGKGAHGGGKMSSAAAKEWAEEEGEDDEDDGAATETESEDSNESDSAENDSSSGSESDEDIPVARKKSFKTAKKSKPQPQLRVKRKKSKHSSKNNNLEQLLESLLEEKLAQRSKASGKTAERSRLTKKDIVQYCHEKLSKKTMYPSSAAMEKAAKKLASKEENGSASFRRAIVKVMRTAMTKQVRGETAKEIKGARIKYYGLLKKEEMEAMLADVSYRKDGAQQYGAQPFLSLLLDVYNPPKQAGGAMQLSAAEVAFAEMGVWLFLNGIPEFPKDTAEGRKQRLEYDRFLAEAAAGINEKALIVKKTN
ncbi:hypothetical protein COCSUDRAFT_60592 [Coccomyxa subellipsoidea C-169]|uniref:Uncharacterized protein n=1 Tax=Coccomyxa subellipsoidea (strain C-169) TaxID=574566 RepID=I0YI82_COCSC|nr:hypothetical protein COCSUDRAFT_60592 [Coccomyxa subellipsoidea C-169]EIE18101.1 hypothetical protein COCSUDRAFT_60592 [Coccomyxa subellipsoidea C-169]|eukprot:XP_005642645.1 hypothetical protein COCSUDRAFT_60592 [Coccomyxa subellipsoidea C-169]